jgi:hypothetical protein
MSRGFRILRFWNHQLDEEIQAVADAILQALQPDSELAAHPLSPTLSARERGPEGTPRGPEV